MGDNPRKLPGASAVAAALGLAVKTQMVSLDDQDDVVKLLRLNGQHEQAAVVREFPPDAYAELVKQARLSLAAARQSQQPRRG